MRAPPLPVHRRPAWQRYTAAIAVSVAVIAVRIALVPVWGYQHNRHLVLLPMVLLAAAVGGFGPGLVAAGLGTLTIQYLTTRPPGPAVDAPSLGDLFLFFAISVALCAILRSMQLARARADEAKLGRERLLAIVAHDLRNPLGTIQLAAAALQRSLPEAEVRPHAVERHLATIGRAVGRMDHLIADLVDVTNIEQGKLHIKLQEERVEPIVREVSETFTAMAQEKGVAFEAGPVFDTAIRADRNRLVQALGNLVGNALTFTPRGGRVKLRAEERDRGVLFAVEDTGPGIPAEHLAHIFDPYWKADSRGMGLGLHIAQSIVVGHGGQLDVSTRPGQGATFSFQIPCTDGPSAPS